MVSKEKYYNIEHSNEDLYIERRFKELSKGRYWFSDGRVTGIAKKESRKIISDNSWNDILFHFEIQWKDGVSMIEAKEIQIMVHLECQHKNNEMLNQKVRTYFGVKDVNKLPDACGVVYHDFSTLESIDRSLKDIIKILDSDDFQKWAKKADECLELLKKDKL